jgi:hypothetical protein
MWLEREVGWPHVVLGGVSELEAVSVAHCSRVTSLDRSALTWALVNGPPLLAAWQLSVSY